MSLPHLPPPQLVKKLNVSEIIARWWQHHSWNGSGQRKACFHCRGWPKSYISFCKMLKTKTAEPPNTDTLLFRKVFFVPGESPYNFSKFNLLNTDWPVNTYNGHLFLAQSTDSHRKLTSLMRTLHHQLCADFSFLKVKKLQFTEFRFSQR